MQIHECIHKYISTHKYKYMCIYVYMCIYINIDVYKYLDCRYGRVCGADLGLGRVSQCMCGRACRNRESASELLGCVCKKYKRQTTFVLMCGRAFHHKASG